MSWEQLNSIIANGRQLVEDEHQKGWVACPNDGVALKDGPDGEKYCPFDGWRPDLDWRMT